MTGITLDLDDATFRAKLQRLIQRMDNLQPALTDIGATLESRVHQRFDFKRDPAGKDWAAWKPSTAGQRAKTGKGELLELTRNMLGSLNHQVDAETVAVGFGARYAIYHEFGTRNMERRGLLTADPASVTLGEGDREAVLGIVEDYLAES